MRGYSYPHFLYVSIHAPTKGATSMLLKYADIASFQSTLLRKERLSINSVKFFRWFSFNPRSYERSDLTWIFVRMMELRFNPRSYERSDRWNYKKIWWTITFQSTLLRKERRNGSAWRRDAKEFQSTLLRKERHAIKNIPEAEGAVSIHAPTKGATLISSFSVLSAKCFNPRSYERSDSNFTQIII